MKLPAIKVVTMIPAYILENPGLHKWTSVPSTLRTLDKFFYVSSDIISLIKKKYIIIYLEEIIIDN